MAVCEAAAAFGLAPFYQREQARPLYIWPENVESWNFFLAVSTQWVIDQGRVIGLNYTGVEVVRKAWRIKSKDWPERFAQLQAMERATLEAWRERRK